MLTYAEVCRYVWEKRFAQLQAIRLCLVLPSHAATHTLTYMYIYVYIYVCVCVCVGRWVGVCVCVCGWVGGCGCVNVYIYKDDDVCSLQRQKQARDVC